MKTAVTPFLNDIVSLSVLALMTLALVAGQADAGLREVAKNTAGLSAPAHISIKAMLEIRVERRD